MTQTALDTADLVGVQRRVVRVLVVAQILGGVGVGAGFAVATLLAADILGSDSLAGLAGTVMVLGTAIAAIPLARLMDRRGRRLGICAGYGVATMGALDTILAADARSFVLLLVGMALFGAASATNLQSRYAAIDLAPADRRARSLSTVVWATTVGVVAGPNLTGHLYLATVIDCCSRRLVGWSIADHMRTELVEDALRAAQRERGSLVGAVFHGDHGAQYTSKDYAALCAELGVIRSMGAVGSSADNALAEAFNATLKRETLQGAARWPSARDARLAVFKWITRYNTRRRHSYCGQLSPVTYEQTLQPATLQPAA